MDTEKTIDEIISNYEYLQVVKDGYLILREIRKQTETHNHINPTRLVLILHDKEMEEYKADSKLYEQKKKNRSDTISKKCRDLSKLGLIKEQNIIQQEDGRKKYYIVTEKGNELLEKFSLIKIETLHATLIPSSKKDDTVERASDFHIEKIREQIQRVIDGIPDIFDYFASPDPFGGIQKIYSGNRLPFEDDLLYPDLANHIGKFISFNELQKQLEDFKQKAAMLPKMKSNVNDAIRKDLIMVMKLDYDQKCNRVNSFSLDMIGWIYNGITIHMESDESESFQKLFAEKDFEIKPNSDGVEVLSDVFIVMNVPEDTHQQKISELRSYMKNIKVAKSYQSVKDFIAYRLQIKQLRENIIHKLSQEIERSVYPGPCEYS